MSFAPRRMIPGLILALVILVIDQLTKIYIVGSVMDPPRVIEVTGFFNLVMAWNYGVSFGLFNEPGTQRWMLIVLSLAVSVALAVWMARESAPATRLALASIIGGAIGNVIDRFRWGAGRGLSRFPCFRVSLARVQCGGRRHCGRRRCLGAQQPVPSHRENIGLTAVDSGVLDP